NRGRHRIARRETQASEKSCAQNILIEIKCLSKAERIRRKPAVVISLCLPKYCGPRGLCMPRYEYRNIQPLPQAEKAFLEWIRKLDEQFTNRDIERRCTVVREALHELYLGRPYAAP